MTVPNILSIVILKLSYFISKNFSNHDLKKKRTINNKISNSLCSLFFDIKVKDKIEISIFQNP